MGGRGSGVFGLGGQGGYERRIKVFVKIKKNGGGSGRRGGQGGCEQRIEVFGKWQKKIGGGREGRSVGSRVAGGSGWM